VAAVAIRDRNGRVQLGAEGRLATIEDPDSGDTLQLLLTDHMGLGQPEPQAWVGLELLPTITGLAWRHLSDGVTAALAEGKISISRPGGLRLAGDAAADVSGNNADPPLAQEAPPKSQPELALSEAETVPLETAAPTSLVVDAISESAPLGARRQELQGQFGTYRGV
jgi:hypothetical protein